MILPRADKALNEPIERLHARYLEAGKDTRKAYESLTADELAFIAREVRRCLTNPKYYLQNYHFIRTKKLKITTIYPLYDSQEVFMEEFMNQFHLQGIIRIICLKARQMGLCLDPDSKVLTAALKWIKISELAPGTEIVSVDEHSPSRHGKGRKMKTGVVQGVVRVRRQAFRITFDDGREIICTGAHPWLARPAGSTTSYWMSIEGNEHCSKKLKIGNHVRWITKPWGDSTYEDGWFGGLLDGEGSLAKPNRNGASICVSQSEGDVLYRAMKYCEDNGYHYRVENDATERNTKHGKSPVPKIVIGRMDEIFRVIGKCRPDRFLDKRFWDGKELPGKNSGVGWAKILSIEPLGERTMIDLQTSEGTYIAEGFVSHNTTISVALMCWLGFLHPMCHVLSMSDEDERVSINFDMARTAYSFLEWWMKPEKRYDQKPQLLGFDRKTQDEREDSTGLEAKIYFESANQPSGAAYSKSLYGAHMAEIGRYRGAKPITEGIFGSLVNYRHSIGVMESTAQGRHTVFHHLWKAAEAGKFWAPIFIEWFREPGYIVSVPENFQRTREEEAIVELVREECKFELTDGQLAWRRGKIEEFAATGDEEVFPQEFPLTSEEAFIASGLTAFPKRRLNEMNLHFGRKPRWTGEIKLSLKNNRTPLLTPYIDGSFFIWEYPRANEEYQVGADCAMGIDGGDYSCAVIYHIPKDINQPIRQVARWRGYQPPTEYARILAAIGYLYNEAEIAPEVNKIDSVASDLSKVLLYPRVYRWLREDKIKNALSQFIGWLTTSKNKSNLIGRFRDALLGWTVVIKCKEDIDEMFDFVETEPGSELFGARAGGHDDTVMAHMIGYYTATQLRPRWAQDDEEKEKAKVEGRDYQNTDYSPIYDGKPSGGPSAGYPDYMEL